jgi:hypothetical protein
LTVKPKELDFGSGGEDGKGVMRAAVLTNPSSNQATASIFGASIVGSADFSIVRTLARRH